MEKVETEKAPPDSRLKKLAKYLRREGQWLAISIIVVVHIGLSLVGMSYRDTGEHQSLHEFFKQMFTTGLFLYSIFFAASLLWFRPDDYLRIVGGIVCISLATSTLFAYDRTTAQNSENRPDSFSGVLYVLLVERHGLFLLAILTIIAFVAGAYYLFRSFFKVTYSGSAMQIELPGQTSYYIPIYPQVSWQNTEIDLKEGDKFSVHIYGYVSPGGLLDLEQLHKNMQGLLDWQKKGCDQKTFGNFSCSPLWPYSGPSGYSSRFYDDPVFQNHDLYKTPNYYQQDRCLTVQGLPHNKVVGLITETEPSSSKGKFPAFEWSADQGRLLGLSSETYPMTMKANATGKLWVVINDVDYARWDNTGLFFMKLTVHKWFR